MVARTVHIFDIHLDSSHLEGSVLSEIGSGRRRGVRAPRCGLVVA